MLATNDPFVGYFVRYGKDVIESLGENREFVREFYRLMAAHQYVDAARHATDTPVVISPPDAPDDPSMEQLARAFALARNPWMDEVMEAAIRNDVPQAERILFHHPSHLLISRHWLKELERKLRE